MRLAKLERTCIACPSQWDGILEDGREVYIRYRYGQLRVNIGNPTLIEPVFNNELLVDKQLGDDLDGVMETGEMLEETGFEYEGNVVDVDEDLFEMDKQNEMYFNSDHGQWLEDLAKRIDYGY